MLINGARLLSSGKSTRNRVHFSSCVHRRQPAADCAAKNRRALNFLERRACVCAPEQAIRKHAAAHAIRPVSTETPTAVYALNQSYHPLD